MKRYAAYTSYKFIIHTLFRRINMGAVCNSPFHPTKIKYEH
uniref:Uncharacterized protein n=1 Tax=Anguilla anguilla TaxID=7936 RepID=A0A0E9TJR7_ANGAN